MPRTKQFCEIETLEKAVELFWNKGFHATSMQDLVSHLGINRASLYATYGDKSDLFKKALCAYTKSNGDMLKNMLAAETNRKEGLRKMLVLISQVPPSFSSSPGCLVVNTAVEMLPNEPQYADIIHESKEVILQILREFFSRTAPSDKPLNEEESNRLAYFTYAFQNGLQVLAKSEKDSSRITSMIDDFVDVFG